MRRTDVAIPLGFAALALLGCGGAAPDATTGTSGAGGAGTTASTAESSSHTAVAVSTAASGTTTGAGGTGGGSGFDCNPAAPPDSLYALNATSYTLDPISMCQYRGEVLLIANIAAV